MTQATNIDIREIKTSIEANTRSIDSIAKATETNTRSIDSIARATEANTTAIATLSKTVTDLTLEMRLGFSNLNGKIDNLDTKLTGRIDTLEAKFEERTKGFGLRLDGKELVQRNITTGLTVVIVGGLLLTLSKYLFLGVNP